MKTRILVTRTLTSGNIRDEAMEQQKQQAMTERREATWAVTIVLIGGLAFIAMAVAMRLAS